MATDQCKPSCQMLRNSGKDLVAAEQEFENLVHKNIPGWTVVWNMLLHEGRELRKKQCVGPMDLRKKIRRKMSELLHEEETLVDLYRKAAEEAKKKEEEFKGKTAVLMEQIEKDKSLMEMLKPVNQ